MRAMELRMTGMLSAGLALALVTPHAFAGTPVQGNFRVAVRVLTPPAVSLALLDAVPAPPGAQRLTRNAAGDSYRCDHDADTAIRHWRDAMAARGYRLVGQSDNGRLSTWDHTHHRVDIEVREVLGATPATRVVVQATPTT